MKNSFKLSVLFIGLLLSYHSSNAVEAYDRFTWSDLVVGKRKVTSTKDSGISVITEWCGLKRIIKSDISIEEKLNNADKIINSKNKHLSDKLFKAVMDSRYLYKYGYKDIYKSDMVLKNLENIPSLKNKLLAERLFSNMNEYSILDNSFCEQLSNLVKHEDVFPYDNGYMPVITKERVLFLLSIKEMIDGKGKIDLDSKIQIKSWQNIPTSILYLISTQNQSKAYKKYINSKVNISPKMRRLIEDFLFPMYIPVKTADRKFLTGLYVIEEFPNLGIDLINESLSEQTRVTKPEHALACLVDAYKRHNAINESNTVKQILSDYYPNSIWLK